MNRFGTSLVSSESVLGDLSNFPASCPAELFTDILHIVETYNYLPTTRQCGQIFIKTGSGSTLHTFAAPRNQKDCSSRPLTDCMRFSVACEANSCESADCCESNVDYFRARLSDPVPNLRDTRNCCLVEEQMSAAKRPKLYHSDKKWKVEWFVVPSGSKAYTGGS